MKQIIVPTDFSKGAWNALQYAAAIGEALEIREILVLNAYSAPHAGAATLVSIDRIMQQDSEEGLSNFMSKVKESGLSARFNFHSKSIHAGLVDAINSQVEDYNESLVVMGSLGETGTIEKIIGSNASAVAVKAQCPVIVIPPTAEFTGCKHVILGSDFDHLSDRNLRILHTVVSLDPSTHLQIVHVKREGDTLTEASMGLDQEAIPHTVEEVDGENVSETLDGYVSTHDTDLLVLIKRESGFFGSMFQSSTTKKLTLLGHVPLLILKQID